MKKDILTDKVRTATSWVLRQPAVVRLRKRFPGLTSFVASRLDTKYFVGLPLTLMVLAAAMNIMLLSNLAESVMEAAWVTKVDVKFNTLFYGIRSEWLSQTLYVATWLGDQQAVFVIGGLATIVFLLRKRWFAIVAFWLAMGGMGLSVRLGKMLISRDRPSQDMAYYIMEHFSFPSGHATTVMGLFGLLAYFLYRHLDAGWLRKLTVAGSLLIIGMVGFSRIYLGVHYLSDVLAGFMLGILWLLVGISLMEVRQYQRRRFNDLHL